MNDGNGLWTDELGPVLEDFEDPPEVETPSARSVHVRVLRTIAVLVLIAALLVYFVVPFNNFFLGATTRWLHQAPRMHLIPVAPEPSKGSTLPV